MRHREGAGSQSCDSVTALCTQLVSVGWSAENAPERYAANGWPPPDIPPGEERTNVVTFDEEASAYSWIDLSGWIRDTGSYGGNPGPTAYASNYYNFPQEVARITFVTPQVLQSIDIAPQLNGPFVVTTDAETATLETEAGVPATLTTGFSEPTSTVTISYVGPSFGIDNIVSVERN
jgi:hypothetical protein